MKKLLYFTPLLFWLCISSGCEDSGVVDTAYSGDNIEKSGHSSQLLSDTVLIKEHFTAITKSDEYRHFENVERLDSVAAYIFRDFAKYADTVFYQEYQVEGETYRNVIGSFGVENKERTIVGAHYDVCGDQEGADDNASGVVGLLELARLLDGDTLSQRIDLVAYTLEEPPFFRTEQMGSHVHARSLVDDSIQISGMICLEMIGYFDDEKNSQDYPVGGMKAIYGSRGDYIALISQMNPGKFVKNFINRFDKTKQIRTKHIAAPKSMPGIDFSDHLNYWKYGFSALMITDTAFYRNKNYHRKSDTLETLDLKRMAQVISAVYLTLI